MTTNQENVSYQAVVDWQEASSVWHVVDGILSYIRYKYVQKNEVSGTVGS